MLKKADAVPKKAEAGRAATETNSQQGRWGEGPDTSPYILAFCHKSLQFLHKLRLSDTSSYNLIQSPQSDRRPRLPTQVPAF